VLLEWTDGGGIALRPCLESGQLGLAKAKPHVGVEVLVEAPGHDQSTVRAPPPLVGLDGGERRPADRDHGADALGTMGGNQERERRAHRGSTPHWRDDAQPIQPEQQVARFLRIGQVLGALELLAEAVAAGIWEQAANRPKKGSRSPTMNEESSTEP